MITLSLEPHEESWIERIHRWTHPFAMSGYGERTVDLVATDSFGNSLAFYSVPDAEAEVTLWRYAEELRSCSDAEFIRRYRLRPLRPGGAEEGSAHAHGQ
jgi:hypothetical protein